MSKLIHLFSLLFVFILIAETGGAQTAGDKIIDAIEQWQSTYPQEKIFIQTNKKQLVAGEDLWFKIWCTYEGKPTFLSRILYVDIVDQLGTVVQKKMYKIDSTGGVKGMINFDKKMVSGNYRINAYTLWMLNFPDFIGKEQIYLYGTDYIQKKVNTINAKVAPIKMLFFPEGGNIINGIKNKIAFKIIDQFGMPINFNGDIVDDNNNSIATFSSEHDGMGYFEIEPNVNVKYKANIKNSQGATLSFNLPVSKKEGIGLSIQNTKNRLFIILNRAEINKDKYKKSLLVAHMNGKLVYAGDFNFEEGKTAASIIKKNLPAGIIHLTLFDSLANPLAERLAFIENYAITQPKVNIELNNTNKRGKNQFNFSLDSTLNENISLLVTGNFTNDDQKVESNIISSILLTSDIKGTVTNSSYYFADKSDKTLKHLDVLMMVHGWRRFLWNDVISKKEPILKYPIESFISIKGKATKPGSKETIKSGKVSMIIKGEDSTKIMADAFLTDKGEFILDSINFKKKATVFYEAQNNKREKLPVDVIIYPSYIDSLKLSKFVSDQNLDTADISNRKNAFTQNMYNRIGLIDTLSFGSTTLADVTVKVKKLSRVDSLEKEYVSSIFEVSDNTIEFADAGNMTNIWQYLRMKISGFEVDAFGLGGESARFTRNDGIRGLSEETDNAGIKFMLNEVEVPALSIDFLSPSDVALVKVYKGNLAFAWGANQGMIAVYTKKGGNVKNSLFDKVFEKIEILGFEGEREFFNSDYEKFPDFNKNLIDRRQTLFWSPSVKKGKTGKYAAVFFNNDIANSYKVLIQGVDKNGKLIFYESNIK